MHSQGSHMSRRAGQSFVAIIGAFVIISVLAYYSWSLSSENGTLKRTIVLTYSKLKDLKTQKGTLEKKNTLLSNRMVEMEESRDTEKQNAENEQLQRKNCEVKNIRIEGEWKNKLIKKQEMLKSCEDASTHREKLLVEALNDVQLESMDYKAQSDIVLAKVKYLKDELKNTHLEYVNFQNKYSDLEKEKIRLEELKQKSTVKSESSPSEKAPITKEEKDLDASEKNLDIGKGHHTEEGHETAKSYDTEKRKKLGKLGEIIKKKDKGTVPALKRENDDHKKKSSLHSKGDHKNSVVHEMKDQHSKTESPQDTNPSPSITREDNKSNHLGHEDMKKSKEPLPVPLMSNRISADGSDIEVPSETATEERNKIVEYEEKTTIQPEKMIHNRDDKEGHKSESNDRKDTTKEMLKQKDTTRAKGEIEDEENEEGDKETDL